MPLVLGRMETLFSGVIDLLLTEYPQRDKPAASALPLTKAVPVIRSDLWDKKNTGTEINR